MRNWRGREKLLGSIQRWLVSGSVCVPPPTRTRKPRASLGSAGHPVMPGKLKLGRFGAIHRLSPTGVP
jgi:hypothetical protein